MTPPSGHGGSGHQGEGRLQTVVREAVEIAIGGNIKRGLAMAIDARREARDTGDKVAELAALNAAARCHSLRNDSIASLSAGTDAAALAQQLGDVKATAHALCSIANTAFTLQLMEESRIIATRTVAVSVQLADDDLECRARQVLGVILGDLCLFDEAAIEIELALAAAQRHGLAAFEYRVQANFASLARKRARFYAKEGDEIRMKTACDEAMAESARIIEIAHREKIQALEITMSALQGEMLALRGDHAGAIARTRFAIDLAARNRQFSNIPPASLRLAAFYRAQDEFSLAHEALLEGLQSAEMLRPTFRIAEICERIAVCEEESGDPASAIPWRERAEEEQASFAHERERARGYLRKIIDDLDCCET